MKFCQKCGTQCEDNAIKCSQCNTPFNPNPQYQSTNNARPPQNSYGLNCPRCGSNSVNVQVVTNTNGKIKTKHRGCLGWSLWILLALCTFGLILIIPLITNSKTKGKITTENRKVATCQNCGNTWNL